MADFDTTLNSILGNPDAMGQIMSLAQSLSGSLGGGGEPAQEQAEEFGSKEEGAEPIEQEPVIPSTASVSRDAALLEALRPYLKKERQTQVDRALEMVGMLRLLRTTFGAAHGSE